MLPALVLPLLTSLVLLVNWPQTTRAKDLTPAPTPAQAVEIKRLCSDVYPLYVRRFILAELGGDKGAVSEYASWGQYLLKIQDHGIRETMGVALDAAYQDYHQIQKKLFESQINSQTLIPKIDQLAEQSCLDSSGIFQP